MDDVAAKRPPDNINELTVKVVRCQNVQARREGIKMLDKESLKFEL